MGGPLEIADHGEGRGGDPDRQPVDVVEGLAGELPELAEFGLAAPAPRPPRTGRVRVPAGASTNRTSTGLVSGPPPAACATGTWSVCMDGAGAMSPCQPLATWI